MLRHPDWAMERLGSRQKITSGYMWEGISGRDFSTVDSGKINQTNEHGVLQSVELKKARGREIVLSLLDRYVTSVVSGS